MATTPAPALTDDLVSHSDSLFASLLRNALVGVYVIQDDVFRYANPRFAEMFGYCQAEICGRISPRDLITPGDHAKVTRAIAERISGQVDSAHYTFRGRHKDGSELELEVFGNRSTFDGRPAIIGMLVDISSRQAVERRATEQLNFIEQLIEAIPSPLFFKDAQARYLGCNRAFEAFLGKPRDEIMGRSVFDISPPELAARYHAADQALFDAPGVQTYEAAVAGADGMTHEVIFNKATWLDSDGRLGGLVGVITDITERKQTEALIWVQANYDPLTGLPNRRLLNDRLVELMKHAHRTGESVAVLFIDLDRFKEVNDVFGHDAGDRLLVEAARRIVGCVRESDTVARQGGDEFTVLLPELSDEVPAERIAGNIIAALDQPFILGSDTAYVSASIGITLFPRDGDTPTAILKHADQAMYHAKDSGRNRFSYYSPSMQEQAQIRQQMGSDLRTALASGHLALHFQPILHLASGQVCKAEALLRWHHPSRGDIPPDEFIPVAEELGLIDAIGTWVFESAVSTVARWRERWGNRGPAASTLQISVNASPRQFTGGRSIDVLLARMAALDLPGNSIAIEITEGLLVDRHPAVSTQLARLAAAGIPVTIDDFGTGYSAMAYLKRLDIDTLKIDRSFVRDLTTDPGDLAITEAIIAMAHKLGIRVVAEGVETLEQQRHLNNAGCDYSQGFLFSRPLPEAEFFELITRQAS